MPGGSRGASDPRFAKVFSDPRFRAVKKKDLKVKLDERFNKKDLKNEFTLLKSKAKVDKYGRKVKIQDQVADNLDKYYKDQDDTDGEEISDDNNSANEDEGEEAKEDDNESQQEDSEVNEDDDESEALATELDPLAKARGLVDIESSDEESESSDEEFVDENDNDSGELDENIPELAPTNRIAIVNLDWDHLKSTDLFATFNSFLPQDGSIAGITIYKSQYGKEKLADEEVNGPPKEIFSSSRKYKKDTDDEESDTDDEDLDLAKASRKLIEENTGEEDGFNSTELRKYQLQRLRYYYAIAEFDSIESAIEIYRNCDGTEFESSGNFFDLRYVPEDMEFEEADIRDSCMKLPNNYQPIEFATDSLRNSKPKLTWDETPVERVQILTKSFKQGELDALDLKSYLASDSEEESISTADINKYKILVGNGSNDKTKDAESEDDGDVDMEFSFTPKGAAKEVTNTDGELSTIEKLRQKEKERRKNRKQKIKELKREAQSKKKTGRKDKEENSLTGAAAADIANLPDLQHFDVREISKLEKLKSKKNKFKNKRQRELEEQLSKQYDRQDNNLTIDDRFAEMVDDHAFAGGSKLLQEERRNRKKQKKN